MIQNEERKEKKTEMKKKDLRKQRSKLKTLTKEESFGSSLISLQRRDQVEAPKFVAECIFQVENRPSFITTDGIYRISGAHSDIQRIKQETDKENYEILKTEENVHALTGALKLFLRELIEPVIPWLSVRELLEAINSRDTETIKMRRIKLIIERFPRENKATLKAILEHLAKVATLEAKNRMGASNLAIVFGPTMMWRPDNVPPEDLATQLQQQSLIMEFLIDHQSSLLSS